MFQSFTSARTTPPDPIALVAAVRAAIGDAAALVIDQSAGLFATSGRWVFVEKATAWSGADLTAAQTAIDTAPALTAQRQAQNAIDAYTSADLAMLRLMLDEINVLRTELNTLRAAAGITPALAMRTESQVRNALRTKAGL
jgi:hypothetical protein